MNRTQSKPKRTNHSAGRSIRFRRGLLGLLLACWLTPLTALALSNQEILRAADQARGNVNGVSWTVELTTNDTKTRSQTIEVKARAFDILAEILQPSKNRGNKIIMLNGNMWFHKPGLSKPVPISRRQRLQGPASYGDIASTNYANDYEATLLEEQAVDGEDCYLFDLKSVNQQNTYERIRYWVSRERLVGVKAEYFTISDKLFKSARMEYDHRIEVDGSEQLFISRIILQDELLSGNTSTLVLDNPVVEPLPDSLFNLNLLR